MKKYWSIAIISAIIFTQLGCKPSVNIANCKKNVEATLDSIFIGFENEQDQTISNVISKEHPSKYIFFSPEIEPTNADTFIASLKDYFISVSNIDITMKQKDIFVSSDGKTAWFFALIDLRYDKEGFAETRKNVRISGILLKKQKNWKITQLHLSQPTVR